MELFINAKSLFGEKYYGQSRCLPPIFYGWLLKSHYGNELKKEMISLFPRIYVSLMSTLLTLAFNPTDKDLRVLKNCQPAEISSVLS